MGQTKKGVHLGKNITKNLYDQKMEGMFCDVKLHLQGCFIWGHACILASASSYFMELFRPSNLQESYSDEHWCSRKPLCIDLDQTLCDIKDLCLICVTKIIDFLYLKELAVPEGHLEHFRMITRHLKVLDLLPLCENSINETSVPNNNDSNSDSADDRVSKDISISSISFQHSRIIQNLVEYGDTQENTNNHSSSNLCNVLNSTRQNGSKYIHKSRKSCELQCCSNTDHNLSHKLVKNKKRILTCQVCNHSIISIKKMLTHIETSNHYGTVCPICSFTAQTVNDMKEHTKGHYNLLPYFCEVCNKRNKFFEHHINHLNVHCRNKKFFCNICQKGFTRHQNLSAHLITHGKQFICNTCDYITSKINLYEDHIKRHKHENAIIGQETNHNLQSGLRIDSKELLRKKFNCKVCDEGFTQKKNLKRHVQLKHLSIKSYNCPFCSYISKRTDLFKCHMKKHHNYIPDKEREILQKEIQRDLGLKSSTVLGTSSNHYSKLVPVQLVTQNDVSSSNSFTTHSKAMLNFKTTESSNENVTHTLKINENDALNTHRSIIMEHNNIVSIHNKNISPRKYYNDRASEKPIDLQMSLSNKERNADNDQLIVCKSNNDSFEVNLNTNKQSLTTGTIDLKENIEEKTMEENNFCPILDSGKRMLLENKKTESTFLEMNDSIWLNEITGELISGNHLINVQLIGSESKVATATDSASLSLGDPISKFTFNDPNSGIPLFELGEDAEDITSNPQTPQASLVELDDQDVLFSWNHLDSSFCSTWILNEATGELNMVSFNIQPINEELKLSENIDSVSAIEDDETALFLNEGTGDLSVIYFNPNKSEYNGEHSVNDETIQNAMETLSEHSNDERDDADDLLNEEFLMASANFMAHEENETFLNELTGELNITNLNCQSQLQDNRVSGRESLYLNEETGEISWNVLDDNMKNELFANSELLNWDFDDSLNCEDLEPFSTDLKDISSHLCLNGNSTNNWHGVDEAADIMLNEFTGELINKM